MRCRLCDAPVEPYTSNLYVLDGEHFDLVRCSRCGVVFVDPFPDLKRIEALYNDEYFRRDYSFGIVEGDYLASEAVREGEYRRILSRIARLTDGRSLLEIGCAAGAFLKEARSQGWNVVGVDISPWAVKTARDRFDLDVRQGKLIEQNFPAANFDAVFFGDLLEHLPDPIGFLNEVKRVVKSRDNGGVVVAKVPTYVNSFYYRFLRKIANYTGLNRRSSTMSQLLKLNDSAPQLPPYHLFEYNPSCVRWLFGKAGLEVFDEERTLMIPEFLQTRPGAWSRLWLAALGVTGFFIESLRLPGGHVVIYAGSSRKGAGTR